MANRKPTTSRNKSTRPTVKRSAPVHQQSLDSRQHPIVGTAMLALMKDMIATRYKLEETDLAIDHDSDIAALAAVMAFVPPSTPEEALAAVCMMYADAESLNGDNASPAVRQLLQRALGVAAWIETRFGIDRQVSGLNYFCDYLLAQRHLPASPAHPYSRPGVAPLHAGVDAKIEDD